jgi:hypothetical protein
MLFKDHNYSNSSLTIQIDDAKVVKIQKDLEVQEASQLLMAPVPPRACILTRKEIGTAGIVSIIIDQGDV